YGDHIELLVLSSLSVILLCSIHLQSSVLQGVNKMFTSSLFMSLCVIIKAILNYFLIRIEAVNIYGAVISTYVSYLVPFVLNLIVMKKNSKIEFSVLKALAPPVVASTGAAAGGLAVYGLLRLLLRGFLKGYLGYALAFVPGAVAAAAVYYFLIRKLGGLTEKDVREISPGAARILARIDKVLHI
ncbi:MAG: polysaccharide biosynthesis C-terminal domain-containing protein, partial [Clostridia bacterium]|nr:polysaccharide biosynthesis C-terminal domain-containing protein [Clostridia bacterium]